MPRPVCGTCLREMTLGAVGVIVQFDAAATDGPYQQWHGDVAKCDTCGATVVFRYADRPTWEHFMAKRGPRLSVQAEKPEYVVRERGMKDVLLCPSCGEFAVARDPIDNLGRCIRGHVWSTHTGALVP